MVIVSFSVFREKLLDGRKTQTLRATTTQWVRLFHKWKEEQKIALYSEGLYANDIKLQIWWKAQSSQRQFLFDALLVNMTKTTLGELTEADWQADGFEEFVEYDQEGCEIYPHIPARIMGLRYFADQLRGWGFDWESDGPSRALLDFEVYQLKFRRVA